MKEVENAKNLAKNYEKLYDNANKPEATAENKSEFAVM